jgi:hypothetical protein
MSNHKGYDFVLLHHQPGGADPASKMRVGAQYNHGQNDTPPELRPLQDQFGLVTDIQDACLTVNMHIPADQ